MPSENSGLRSAIGAIIVAVIVIAIIVVVKLTAGKTPAPTFNSTGTSALPASVAKEITSVPQSTLTAVGTGTAVSKPISIKAPALKVNNKPEVLYEGAEYCPYCATERWAITVALSKFGTFSNLKATHSSTTDVYPNTQTVSYYGSSYSSKYITFTPIEVYTNIPNGSGGYTTLQTPTQSESSIINKYDATPYLPSSSAGSIPFIDFGGRFLSAGATYEPTVLQNKSLSTIASSLADPTSPIAKGADGAANTIIATICKLTNNQPASTCTTPVVQAIETSL